MHPATGDNLGGALLERRVRVVTCVCWGGHSCQVAVGMQGVKAYSGKTVKSGVRHGAGVRLSTGSGDTGLPETNRMPQLHLYSRYTRTDCACQYFNQIIVTKYHFADPSWSQAPGSSLSPPQAGRKVGGRHWDQHTQRTTPVSPRRVGERAQASG